MTLRPAALAACLALAGCAARAPRPEAPAAPPAAATPAAAAPAPVPVVYDYRYRLLDPQATGTEQVFDDGLRTFVRFADKPPAGVMFFEHDGQPVAFTLADRFAIITGIHPGVLIRSTTRYSYAAPIDAGRVAGVRARREGGSPPVAGADLPPELAAQRAIILETEARLAGAMAGITPRASMADLTAVNRELDEVQTIIDGLAATMVRLYFATGRTAISLSPGAREILRLAARGASAITVRGRTDNVGGPADNLRIARARTAAARGLLLRFGVPADRIRVDPVAMGDYLADNATEAGRGRNRRVELVFVAAGEPLAAETTAERFAP